MPALVALCSCAVAWFVECRSMFSNCPRYKSYDAMALAVSENLSLVGVSPVRQLTVCHAPRHW